jgi:RNA polymerase sigma-70 factor (ECF subfamily)
VDLEGEMRLAFDRGEFAAVATRALEAYGPEILGVLAARLRSTSQAAEAFSIFTEDLWRGLPQFEWRCSLRAWAHRVARNAAVRYVSAPAQRPKYNVALSEASEVWQIAERVRSTTEVHARSEVKSEMRRLREQLPEEDQMILVLRIDKDMEWRDIAAALAEEDLDDVALARETARVRKRFQLAKDRLRELAKQHGLLPDD